MSGQLSQGGGNGEGCRDKAQLRKHKIAEDMRSFIITSLGKGESNRLEQVGENFLMRFSLRVMGKIWINGEGRRIVRLGTSRNESTWTEVGRGQGRPRRDQYEDSRCLRELKSKAGWEELSISGFLKSAHFF